MKRFRVYDINKKRYLYDDEFTIQEGKAVGFNYPLEQSSGINDIDGNTIYEHDKIHIKGCIDGHYVDRYCLVKHKHACFVVNIVGTYWHPLFIARKYNLINKIVGTINDA